MLIKYGYLNNLQMKMQNIHTIQMFRDFNISKQVKI